VGNIQLPPTLLSRFDLIYLILDHERPDSDRRLAQHLVALYHPDGERPGLASVYSAEQLTDYISYAKEFVHPAITEEAAVALQAGYLDMRRAGLTGGKKTITATTRQLESLIRLSEAHARMRLSAEVTTQDVTEAVRIINVATQRAAVNPRTGTIDMDLLTTGHAAGERDTVLLLQEGLQELLRERAARSTTSANSLMKEIAERSTVPIDKQDVEQALRNLANEDDPIISYVKGVVTVLGGGRY